MGQFLMAEANSRVISGEDKIFGVNKKAQEMIAKVGREHVANATVGALLDDAGKLVVLSSVVQVLKELSPEDFAEYAPISGTPSFLDAAMKAVFLDQPPQGYMGAVATPGGTGAIHNTVQNYTRRGDAILTSDWYWSPYKTIAEESERSLETFVTFDESNSFHHASLRQKVNEILARQDRLLIILNTPAHNPTGYSLTDADWDGVLSVATEAVKDPSKKIVILVDIAYLDFAGDANEYRTFMQKFSNLPETLLPLFSFSMSKSFTLYGMRGGALICLSPNPAIVEEFKMVISYSNRGTWSNGNRSAMVALSRIFADPNLLSIVTQEREEALSLLLRRGQAFTEAAKEVDLSMCPYDAGFFVIVNCENPETVSEELFQDGIFTVPFNNRGLRVSIASISEDWCRILPGKMAAAIRRING